MIVHSSEWWWSVHSVIYNQLRSNGKCFVLWTDTQWPYMGWLPPPNCYCCWWSTFWTWLILIRCYYLISTPLCTTPWPTRWMHQTNGGALTLSASLVMGD